LTLVTPNKLELPSNYELIMGFRLLDEAYKALGYDNGRLLNAVSKPTPLSIEKDEWLEKGDWLALANKVGAEKIFFVKNDPVVVFQDFAKEPDESELLNTFRRAWCMARPQHLFVSRPGLLEVYSLNQPPPRRIEDWKPLDVARTISEVSENLNIYRREQIESGHLYSDQRVGNIDDRADKRLIEDLKTVRKALLDLNLKDRYAHSLIGRSIFIRYLEDRGVLTPAYFEERIAGKNSVWKAILKEEPEKPDLMLDLAKRRYDRVLRDKVFTYALFDQLAEDFNGDMFPRDKEEEAAVTQDHLNLLRGFLLGETTPQQPQLFFWAYDFEIVPIELISNIYEEFYHKTNEDDKGTHYTPSVLVDYVLSQILTNDRLATNPKILDPACGSGIFLVEAFRRIVRYHVQQQGYIPSHDQLHSILRDQITGVEINEEAVHVAAFSLYLALLHYQEPPDILAQIRPSEKGKKPLPHLIYSKETLLDSKHFNVLFHADTFGLMHAECNQLEKKLMAVKRFAGRSKVKSLHDSPAGLSLEPNSFDVIVGNPPWGFKKKKEASQEIEQAQQQAQKWCEAFGWSIGDKELSQAFIARSLSLLKNGGVCGLLVSAGVFLKHHSKSQRFRKRWLEATSINAIVNFTHVRQLYFSVAISPFVFVHYEAKMDEPQHRVRYWSAKKSSVVDNVQSVVLSLPDLHQVKQVDLINNETLWKVYWWGSHRDASLINTLNINTTLDQLAIEREWKSGRGFQGLYSGSEIFPSDWLKSYKELPIECFHRYGVIRDSELVPVPDEVTRFGTRELYSGLRLLIKRGITQANGADGRIESRLDDKSFSFRNSVHAIRMDNAEEWERKALLGILWSSLARYYFFMTASSWGTWHHEIHLEEIRNLPVRFPKRQELVTRIVRIVDELRGKEPVNEDLFSTDALTTRNDISDLERQLDDAIFELYDLSDAEQDLILDTCTLGLDFFYNDTKSAATQKIDSFPENLQGLVGDIPERRESQKGLEGYLHAFLQTWNRELEPDGEFFWRVIRPVKIPMIACVFTTKEKGIPLPDISVTDDDEWTAVLDRCGKTLLQPVSRNVYVDGMVRAVSDTDIIIIKRDERRLWTRSLAREDAEATLLQAIRLQENVGGGD
jgi:type I restriction-modification system DNA methylase subunit